MEKKDKLKNDRKNSSENSSHSKQVLELDQISDSNEFDELDDLIRSSSKEKIFSGNNTKAVLLSGILAFSIGIGIGAAIWANGGTNSSGKQNIIANNRDSNSGTYEVFVDYGLLGDESFSNGYQPNTPFFQKNNEGDWKPNWASNMTEVANNDQVIGNVSNSLLNIGYTSFGLVENNTNIQVLSFIIDSETAEKDVNGKQYWETVDYINKATFNGNDVIRNGEAVYYVKPTHESIAVGDYTLARNFHMTWLGEDFFDPSDPMYINEINPWSVNNWPVSGGSDFDEEKAVTLAFYSYATLAFDDANREQVIKEDGLQNRPKISSWTDSFYAEKLWPFNNNYNSVSDIKKYLDKNVTGDSFVIKIQGSTSTRNIDSKLIEEFSNAMGIDIKLDQTFSNGSGSAFNLKDENEPQNGYNALIGTQSRRFKSSEAFNSNTPNGVGNITYVEYDVNNGNIENSTANKIDTKLEYESALSDPNTIVAPLDYYSYAIDALAIIINNTLATSIEDGSLVNYASPWMLRDIYLEDGIKSWDEIINKHYKNVN